MTHSLVSDVHRRLLEKMLTDVAGTDINADKFKIACCDEDASPMVRFVRSNDVSSVCIGNDAYGAYVEISTYEESTFRKYLQNLNIIELAYLVYSA